MRTVRYGETILTAKGKDELQYLQMKVRAVMVLGYYSSQLGQILSSYSTDECQAKEAVEESPIENSAAAE